MAGASLRFTQRDWASLLYGSPRCRSARCRVTGPTQCVLQPPSFEMRSQGDDLTSVKTQRWRGCPYVCGQESRNWCALSWSRIESFALHYFCKFLSSLNRVFRSILVCVAKVCHGRRAGPRGTGAGARFDFPRANFRRRYTSNTASSCCSTSTPGAPFPTSAYSTLFALLAPF